MTDKVLILIGNIINTLVSAVEVVNSFLTLILPVISIIPQVSNKGTAVSIAALYIVAVAVGDIVVPVLCWLAYSKIGTLSQKKWKIFLLIIGIVSVFASVSLAKILALALGKLIVAVCFIVSFMLKGKVNI